MDNEVLKLQQAKMYMDCLANGMDPISNTDANDGTLRREQVLACFRYISDVLAKHILEAASSPKHDSADCYITEEQCAELQTFPYPCKVTELANEINRITAVNGAKKISAVWINDWLEAEGLLCQSSLRSRISTEKGELFGISTKYRKRNNGDEYYTNYFSEQAQQFVFDHVIEIIASHDKRRTRRKTKVESVNFPPAFSVKEFIQLHSDKCFILSIGSCDFVSKLGSYTAVLLYKNKVKVLERTDISTTSANKCILEGILDAAASIKMPTDVMILTSTPVGFHSPKSDNYDFCQEIRKLLTEKGCSIAISACQGKGHELNSFVHSFL